jgi:phosphoserine phosphatase/prenyltransferase beta subunit
LTATLPPGGVALSPIKIAALDIDGTLLPGRLGGVLPRMLLDAGLCRRDRWQRLDDYLRALPQTGLEDPALVMQTYELYGAMLEGVSVTAVTALAGVLWEGEHRRLFSFAEPLVTDMRHAGFVPMLISGGLQELVTIVGRALGVERCHGLRLETNHGVYTGRLSKLAGAPKGELAGGLAGGRQICWPDSVALGNSLPDADLLERVGHPFAFEPSSSLGVRARDCGWPVVDRSSAARIVRARLGIGPFSSPAAEVRRADSPPRSDDVGPSLRAAQGRLTEHVVGLVDAGGAVDARCESRVVESALMLTLLRREHLLPGIQDALQAYLARSAPGARPFDAALIDAVLRGVRLDDAEPTIDRVLGNTDHSGVDRKRLTLSAVLAMVGAGTFTRNLGPGAFDSGGEVPWTRMLLLAIKVFYLSEFGYFEGPELFELQVLLEAGQRRGVWGKHLFTHLMALVAINRVRPGHPSIRKGVAFLAACQNSDGGMPFVVGLEIYATATAGSALSSTGVDPRLLDAMAGYLVDNQGDDGGWGMAPGVLQHDVDDTSHSALFLHSLGSPRYSQALSRAREYLRSMAGADGGFPTYLPGQRSEPAMTGMAMAALAPCGFTYRAILDRAARYLLSAQRPDATFGRSWSLCEGAGIFLAVRALSAAGDHGLTNQARVTRASIEAAQKRLLYTQRADGGWGQTPSDPSDPISTAYSLIALARTHRHSDAVRNGVRYLLSRQSPNGGFVSPPDQTGPRPLPYTIPVLADNWVLLAMTELTATRSGEIASHPGAREWA